MHPIVGHKTAAGEEAHISRAMHPKATNRGDNAGPDQQLAAMLLLAHLDYAT